MLVLSNFDVFDDRIQVIMKLSLKHVRVGEKHPLFCLLYYWSKPYTIQII